MVLTPSRYHKIYFLNIDLSMFLNINHDDVRRHDSTVHYSFYDDVLVMIAQYITFSMTTWVVMIAVKWLILLRVT